MPWALPWSQTDHRGSSTHSKQQSRNPKPRKVSHVLASQPTNPPSNKTRLLPCPRHVDPKPKMSARGYDARRCCAELANAPPPSDPQSNMTSHGPATSSTVPHKKHTLRFLASPDHQSPKHRPRLAVLPASDAPKPCAELNKSPDIPKHPQMTFAQYDIERTPPPHPPTARAPPRPPTNIGKKHPKNIEINGRVEHNVNKTIRKTSKCVWQTSKHSWKTTKNNWVKTLVLSGKILADLSQNTEYHWTTRVLLNKPQKRLYN